MSIPLVVISEAGGMLKLIGRAMHFSECDANRAITRPCAEHDLSSK